MLSWRIKNLPFILSLLLIVTFGLSSTIGFAKSPEAERVKTITVTIDQKGHTGMPALDRNDFLVYEDGSQREVLSVLPATDESAPLNLAIVIQEGIPQVNSEIKSLQKFISGLPEGSQVMIAYLNGNFIDVRQPFTTDIEKAAGKLRVVASSTNMPSSPYLSLIDVMKKFNGMNQGR